MEPAFWEERWRRGETGFDQAQPHPALDAHWDKLETARGERVFVPLAGKTVDMAWLRARGHPVVASELSDIAVRAFYAGAHLTPTIERRGEHERYAAGGVEMWRGDHFALRPDDVRPYAAVYDRAALVALPPPLRARYARKAAELDAPKTRTLLVTLAYDQDAMPGPPFSVPEADVRALYGATHRIRVLERGRTPQDAARFAARGAGDVTEMVTLLERL